MSLPVAESAFDIAIVGGGLVGASLAVSLADAPLRVVLIEAAPAPATAARWDERCIALNDGSRRLLAQWGVWEALAPQAAAITHTHISERGRFGVARFSAGDAELDALGHNTPLRTVGAALLARAQLSTSLQWRCPARVQAVALGESVARLTLDSGEVIAARLVVAADGASSALRGLLGLKAEVRDYGQAALVTAVRVQRDPVGVAYERFTPTGPFALLPKPRLAEDTAPGYPCSLIWTLPTAEATELAALGEPEFLALAQQAFGERVGRFLSGGMRQCYPLQRTVSEALTAPRVVFCGNAAQSLHPVAAQGFNLGLRDVAALASLLQAAAGQGHDTGDATLLATYAAQREPDRRRTADFTDRLVRLFSNQLPVLSELRHLGLLALDLTPAAKHSVLRQNLGHRGLAA